MGEQITLVVGDREFLVVKNNLVRNSSYFEAMFTDKFLEERMDRIELHSVDPDSVEQLLGWLESGQLDGLDWAAQLQLLRTADMLQVEGLQADCLAGLVDSLSPTSCWAALDTADQLSIPGLARRAEQEILWRYGEVTAPPPATASNLVTAVLSSPGLNTNTEVKVVQDLAIWADSTDQWNSLPDMIRNCVAFQDISKANIEDVFTYLERMLSEKDPAVSEKIFPEIQNIFHKMNNSTGKPTNGVVRALPRVVCVVGQAVMGGVGRQQDRQQEVRVWAWNWAGRAELTELAGSRVPTQPGLQGCQLSCAGTRLVLSGGEFALGHSYWQREVMTWDSLGRVWRQVATAQTRRRHHAALLLPASLGSLLLLMGGFGRHRVILDSVEWVELETGRTGEWAGLPVPLFRPAATLHSGRVVVVGRQRVMLLDPAHPAAGWTSLILTNSDLEPAQAFSVGSRIFLCSPYSTALYALQSEPLLTAASDTAVTAELVGKFCYEMKSTCSNGELIYNFGSDEFGDERAIETFNTRTGELKLLWKMDLPNCTFSPQFSLGCFSLVDYSQNN